MKKDNQGFAQWLAWKLPNKIVYYVLIRAWAYATTGKYSKEEAPAILAEEMIRRWGTENK